MNYLKLDTVPGPDQDWSPVLKAMRDGNFFVSTGRDRPIKNYLVTGSGNSADDYGGCRMDVPDGVHGNRHGGRQSCYQRVITATEMQAFGTRKLTIPFDATGKKWVRFAMWDVAGNGAFTQPQWLTGGNTTN